MTLATRQRFDDIEYRW